MKYRISVLGVFLALLIAPVVALQPDAGVAEKVETILKQVRNKLERTKDGEKPDVAAELKALDALFEKHKATKMDLVGEILVAKARVYLEVLEDSRNGLATFKKLAKELPDVSFMDGLRNAIASLEQKVAYLDAEARLKPGVAFPDFQAKDFAGKGFSLSGLKGKVVLVDFWATWCLPCIEEMPELKAMRKQNSKAGFEIVGVNLDEERPSLDSFMKREKLPWPIIPDPDEKLAATFGASKLPTKYLLGRDGKIVGKWTGRDKRGLTEAIEKALAAN